MGRDGLACQKMKYHYFVKDDKTPWSQATTLEDYIRTLLKEGKRSKDPEFQTLMRIYSKREPSIAETARRILQEEKARTKNTPSEEKKE
jgi:hypothetical protein